MDKRDDLDMLSDHLDALARDGFAPPSYIQDVIEIQGGIREDLLPVATHNSAPVADEPWRDYGDEHQERA